MERSNRIAGVIAALGILVACLFGSTDYHAFNKSYYESEYTKLNTAESIGMSREALFEATDALLDYLKDKRDDIRCVQEVKGFSREVFDERETAHMVDVKALYQNAKTVCFVLIGAGLLALLYMLYGVKKRNCSSIDALISLKDGFRQVVLAFLIVAGGLVFYALLDFNRFWTSFHELFFTNDLWLLDPRVSIMINMFPEEFFFGMVMRIALTFIFTFTLIAVLVYFACKRYLKASFNQSESLNQSL